MQFKIETDNENHIAKGNKIKHELISLKRNI